MTCAMAETKVPDEVAHDPYKLLLYNKALHKGKERENIIRIAVVGNFAQGKSSLANRLIGRTHEGVTTANGVELNGNRCQISDDGRFTLKTTENKIQEFGIRVATMAFSAEITKGLERQETNLEQCLKNDHSVQTKTRHEASYPPTLSSEELVSFSDVLEKQNDTTPKCIDIWDFGGQYIFYATHTLFHSRRALYRLVFDLTKPLDIIVLDEECLGETGDKNMEYFMRFWLESIHAYVVPDRQVVLVGTHQDNLEGHDPSGEEYFEKVRCFFEDTDLIKHIQREHFTVDNYAILDPGIADLLELILKKHEGLAQPIQVSALLLPEEKALRTWQVSQIISFQDVIELDKENEIPLQDEERIKLVLHYYHEKGKSTFGDDGNFICLDQKYLKDAFKCIITSEQFCKYDPDIRPLLKTLSKEGWLLHHRIDTVWSNSDADFMKHKGALLGFLKKQKIIAEDEEYNVESEEKKQQYMFIVPSLLKTHCSNEEMNSFLSLKTQSQVRFSMTLEKQSSVHMIYSKILAAGLGIRPVVYLRTKRLLFENICVLKLSRNYAGLLEMWKDTDKGTTQLRVINLLPNPVESHLAGEFRRFVESVVLKVKLFPSTYRCNHADHRPNGGSRLSHSKEDEDIFCPDNVTHESFDYKRTKEESSSENTIEEVFPNMQLTEKILSKLTQLAIEKNWPLLGPALKINGAEIDHIEEKNKTIEMQIYKMLLMWIDRSADKATLDMLVEAIKKCPGVSIYWDEIRNIRDKYLKEQKKQTTGCSPDKDWFFGECGETPEEIKWCYSSPYMQGNCKLQRKTLVLFVHLTFLSSSATEERNIEGCTAACCESCPYSLLQSIFVLCISGFAFYMDVGLELDQTTQTVCDTAYNKDGAANSNMTMKGVVEKKHVGWFKDVLNIETLHLTSRERHKCIILQRIKSLQCLSPELLCRAVPYLQSTSSKYETRETNSKGYYQTGSIEFCEVNPNEDIACSNQWLRTVPKNETTDWTGHSLNEPILVYFEIDENDKRFLRTSSREMFADILPAFPDKQAVTKQPNEESENRKWSCNGEKNRKMKRNSIKFEDTRPERFEGINCKLIENTKKRKLQSVSYDENVDHNTSAKERRICIAYLFPVKRKKSEEDKCAKRRRLDGVAYDENVEHKKSAKERRICIAYLFPVKRKKSEEDECAKRRRLEGVASRSSDDDYDYCEIIHAFSLHKKRSINTDLVSFLIDLLHILRRDSMGKIEECVYTFTEDEVHMAKEFFVEQECFQHEASKPLRQDSYLIRYATEDTDSYALPGIDYEIHLPLLKSSGDGEVPSKNMNLSNDLHLIEKADHQHQVEHFSDICQCCGRRHTLEFDQPNEEVYPVKTGQPNEGQTSERLNEVGKVDHLDEAKQIKLVTASAGSRQLEQVYTETSMTVQEKKGEIQVQVLPNDFVCQSDVASVSKENLQEALNSADCIRDETFKNLEYKMVTHYPFQTNMFFEKCDDPYFHTEKKNFAPPEDTEKDFYRELEMPQPQIDTSLLKFIALPAFDPVLAIIDQIANGTPPTPHISMRYELLRLCTLRSYPKENKPYLIKLAEAGFYYASDGDGVVCYCCGVRRYNWVAEDRPMEIHERINPNCKFLRKNEEVNVPVQYFGPYNRALMAIIDIPEPRERSEQSEDVNNDWAPERIRSPAPSQQNRQVETGANSLGINTATPKHTQYATKTTRESSFSEWPDTASHTPQELAEAGFFYAGFGDCVRCFYCGIGLRHWTKDDSPWIEHARWSRNCVFVKQKKGEEFVNLVQLAVQYSQDNEAQGNATAGSQLPVQEIERVLLSDAAQSVLEMGYQPKIIKKAIEQILRQNDSQKITAQILMEKVLEIEEAEKPPQTVPAPNASAAAHAKPASETASEEGASSGKLKTERNGNKIEKGKASAEDKHKSTGNAKNNLESTTETLDQDPKAIKAENEQLKEQTLCKVCLDNTVCIVFLPCGHLVTCADCAPAMRKCPICRALVKGTVRTYMS